MGLLLLPIKNGIGRNMNKGQNIAVFKESEIVA